MKSFLNRNELIKEYVKPGDVGAEVGVYRGGFSRQIAERDVGHLYCIDAWTQYKAYEIDSLCHTNQDDNHQATRHELKQWIDRGQCTVIKGFSAEVARGWKTPLDFLYLDSIHTYEFVIEDLREWSKHIKPGGVIMGHDFTETSAGAIAMNFGVVRAFNEFCTEAGWEIVATTQEPDWPSVAIMRK